MKYTFVSTLLLAFSLNSLAQEYILRNVESERICNILLMELSLTKDTAIVYYKDQSFLNFPQNGHIIKPNQDFSVTDNNVNLMFRYLNPLKYSITINSSERDDEELKNGMKAFMSGISGLTSLTSGANATLTTLKEYKVAINTPTAISKAEKIQFGKMSSGEKVDSANKQNLIKTQKLKSLEAIQLFVFLNQVESDGNSEMDSIEVENLFSSIENCDSTYLGKAFEDTLKVKMKKLINANNIKELAKVIEEINMKSLEDQAVSDKIISVLRDFKYQNLVGSKNNLKAISKESSKVISNESTKANYYSFIAEGYGKILIDRYNAVIENRKALIENLKKVVARAKSFSDQNFWRGEYFALIQSFDVNRTSFYDISIVIKAYKYNFDDNSFVPTENTILTQKFSLKRIRQAILSFSGLGMYTNATYSQYLTDVVDGKSVIKETKTNRNYYNIGIAMNVLPNIRNTMFLPGLQFATSVANGYPCFLGGICFVWPDYNLNISGGVMFGWNQILTGGLKPGDEASDAKIKENTSWEFSTKGNFYLGISYNIPWH